MKHRWNSLPIVYKLFITLFGGIAVIIIALLSYLWGYESELMLTKEQDLLHIQSIDVANDLSTHLVKLQKEILFLSQLEVMNDMVTQDMDRRITSILEQKADDLEESITLYTIAPDFTVTASSQATLLNTTLPEKEMVRNAIKRGENTLFFGENLYFFTPI